MSERISTGNLDQIVKKNEEIRFVIEQNVLTVKTTCNTMQVNSSAQHALQLLRTYGLILLPIENEFWSGAIFVRDGKKIPVINTAQPRANQYFTAWHEFYHLNFDQISFDHVIEADTTIEERKAEYFSAQMMLGNLWSCYSQLPGSDFLEKVFRCMEIFQAPYKAVLISLYENALNTGDTLLKRFVKEHFDRSQKDLPERFRELGLDDSLVKPSYIINFSELQGKIDNAVLDEPEVSYHKDNASFLQTITKEIRMITGEKNG